MSQASCTIQNKGLKKPTIKLNFSTQSQKNQEKNDSYMFNSNLLNVLQKHNEQNDIQNKKTDNTQLLDQQIPSLCLQHKSKIMFICEDDTCIQKEKTGCNKCMNAYHNQHKTKLLDYENEKEEMTLQKSFTQVKQSFMRFQNCIKLPTSNRQINQTQAEDQKKQDQETQIENELNGCVFNNSQELQQKSIQNQMGQQLIQQSEQQQQNQIVRVQQQQTQQLTYPALQQCNMNQISIGQLNQQQTQQYLLEQQKQVFMFQPQYMQMVTLYPQTYAQNCAFNMQYVMPYPMIPTIYCQNPYMMPQQNIQNKPFQNTQSNLNYAQGQINNIPNLCNTNTQTIQTPQIYNQNQIPQQTNNIDIKSQQITNQTQQNIQNPPIKESGQSNLNNLNEQINNIPNQCKSNTETSQVPDIENQNSAPQQNIFEIKPSSATNQQNNTNQNVQQLRPDACNFSSFGQPSNQGNKKVNVQYFIDNKCMKSQYTSLDKVIHQHIDYYPSLAFLNAEKFIQISLNTYEMKYYLNLVDIKTKKIQEKREVSPIFQTLKQSMQFDENKKIIVQKINNDISAIYERGQDFIDIISNVNLKVVKRIRQYSIQKIASYNKGRGLAIASLSGKVTLYNINCNKFQLINEFNVKHLKASISTTNQNLNNIEQEEDQFQFREQFQFLLNCDIFIQNNILLWCGSSLFTFTYCLIDIKSSARLIINPTSAKYPNNILNDNINKIQISNVQMFNDRVYFEFNHIDKKSDHFESSMNSNHTLLLSKYNVLQYKFSQEEKKFVFHSPHPNSNIIKSYKPLKQIFLFNQQKSHIIGIQLINKCKQISEQGGKSLQERNLTLKNVVYPNIVSRKNQKDFEEIKFKMNLSLLQNSQTFYVYLTKSKESQQTNKNEQFITLVDNKKIFHKVFLSQSQYTTKLA